MGNSKLCKSQQTQQRIMDIYLDTMREKHWDKITVRQATYFPGYFLSILYRYL